MWRLPFYGEASFCLNGHPSIVDLEFQKLLVLISAVNLRSQDSGNQVRWYQTKK